MGHDGARWIEELPAGLAAQRDLLRGLLAFSQADPDVKWLVVGCSLARGAGDWLSDIDAAVGFVDEQLPAAFARARSAVDGLGELVESFHHQLPGLALTHERVFAQYADRSQLDLVVYPATVFAGSIPNVVVLYDPEDLLAVPGAPDAGAPDAVAPDAGAPVAVPPEQVREWAFLGWGALADLGKYVRRGSGWEALERLHEARAQLWQLWAAVRGVPQPQYGLTSVLDYAAVLPEGIEETVSGLDVGSLLAAGLRVAELLGEVGGQLGEEQRAALPSAMGSFVLSDLRAAVTG
jgi:predicted nucleotidyltransferase